MEVLEYQSECPRRLFAACFDNSTPNEWVVVFTYLPRRIDCSQNLQVKDSRTLPELVRNCAVSDVVLECPPHTVCGSTHSLVALPRQEMMYAWNGFRLLAQDPPLVKTMLAHVWSELVLVEETKGSLPSLPLPPPPSLLPSPSPHHTSPLTSSDDNPFYVDDYVVVTLMQGVCFRAIHRHDEAEKCFKSILRRYLG